LGHLRLPGKRGLQGEADFTLNGDFTQHKLYALSVPRKSLFEVEAAKSPAALTFTASAFTPRGQVMAYELVRE